MTTPCQRAPLSIIQLVARGVYIEMLRKKDAWVLALFILVFCIGAAAARMVGIENPATGTFLLNLGLTLAYLFAHGLTLMLSVRQIPDDLEHRTIFPMLARPVSRGQFLTGKWVACASSGFATYLIFALLVWFTTPKMEPYETGLFLQNLWLQMGSLSMLAALAILGSLLMPKAMVAVLLGAWVFIGHLFKTFICSAVPDGAAREVVTWGINCLPDFSKLNLTTRYSDGIDVLQLEVFVGLIAHALFFCFTALSLGYRVFNRRVL